MTKLIVNNLISPSDGNLTSKFIPQSIEQVQVTRVDIPLSYTVSSAAAGTNMTDLAVTIVPKFSSSIILCFFQIHGEGATTHDWIYSVNRSGSQTALYHSYPPHNSFAGLNAWSGIAQALPYETDYNSTPFTKLFMYYDIARSTSSRTYAPTIKSSTGVSYVYYVNRTLGSATGASAHEVGVSYSVAMEISV